MNFLRVGDVPKLLIANELCVHQVGFKCGFQNRSHFHYIFKNQIGFMLLAYRKNI